MKKRDIGPIACVILVVALLIAGVVLVLQHTEATFGPGTTQMIGSTFAGVPADTSNLPTVYASNFANGDSRGWTSGLTDRTPNNQPFLGQFNNELVSLKVSQLPEHEMLRVSFDLYVINTWDGSGVISAAGGKAGPDYFLLGLEEGRTLLCATFSNLPETPNFADDGKLQTYPSPIPSRPVKGGTGSSGVHSLGYVFTYNPPGVSFPQDSAYAMSFVFPHTADSVHLNFVGMGLQSVRDEGWGVANVKVELVQPPDAPDEARLARWWQTVIGERDPVGARDAFWSLVAAREATVRFIEKQDIGFGIDREKVEGLLAKLSVIDPDADLIQTLADMGPAIEPHLRVARIKAPSLGATLDELRGEIEVRPLESPGARRIAAASRLLEMIGSAEAERVQAALGGKPDLALQPGTPDYAQDWRRRFSAIYSLSAAENIKYIPRPAPPEREMFLKERRDRLQEAPRPDRWGQEIAPIDLPLIAFTAGRVVTETPIRQINPQRESLPEKGLSRIMTMLGLKPARTIGDSLKIEVSPSLEDLELPGDWLLRPRVNQSRMIEGLVRIIEDQTGRRVRFVRETENENVIVARGRYAFQPENAEHTDGRLRLYADRLDPPGGDAYTQTSSLISMFNTLNANTGLRFVDETQSGKERVTWTLHSTALRRHRDPAERQQQITALLAHLSQQTGLTFSQEQRPVEKLVAREEAP